MKLPYVTLAYFHESTSLWGHLGRVIVLRDDVHAGASALLISLHIHTGAAAVRNLRRCAWAVLRERPERKHVVCDLSGYRSASRKSVGAVGF